MSKKIFKLSLFLVLLIPSVSMAQAELRECDPFQGNSCYDEDNPCINYRCEANPRAWIGQPDFICVGDGVLTTEEAEFRSGICDDDPNQATCNAPACTDEGQVVCVAQVRDFDQDGLDNVACGGIDCNDANETVGEVCEEEVVEEAFCGDGIVNGDEECDNDVGYCTDQCRYNWANGQPCSQEVAAMFGCVTAGEPYICPVEEGLVDFTSIECEDRLGISDEEPVLGGEGFEEVPGCGDGWLDPNEECEFGDPLCDNDCRFIRGTGTPCDDALLAEYGCEEYGDEYICMEAVDFDAIECKEEQTSAGGFVPVDEPEVVVVPDVNEVAPEIDQPDNEVEEFVAENEIPVEEEVVEDQVESEPRCVASEKSLQWVPITIDDAREVMKKNNMTVNKDGEKVDLRYNSKTGQIEQYTACLVVGKEMELNFTGSSCQLSGTNYFSYSQALVYFFGLLITFGFISSLRQLHRKNS
jgi:hypothetical protein